MNWFLNSYFGIFLLITSAGVSFYEYKTNTNTSLKKLALVALVVSLIPLSVLFLGIWGLIALLFFSRFYGPVLLPVLIAYGLLKLFAKYGILRSSSTLAKKYLICTTVFVISIASTICMYMLLN